MTIEERLRLGDSGTSSSRTVSLATKQSSYRFRGTQQPVFCRQIAISRDCRYVLSSFGRQLKLLTTGTWAWVGLGIGDEGW